MLAGSFKEQDMKRLTAIVVGVQLIVLAIVLLAVFSLNAPPKGDDGWSVARRIESGPPDR